MYSVYTRLIYETKKEAHMSYMYIVSYCYNATHIYNTIMLTASVV